MRPFLIALFAAVACALPAIGSASTTGELTGTLVDEGTNKPLADAHVTARSPSQVEHTVSDAAGRFAFVSLAPGTYTVVVSLSGYVTAACPGIVVSADIATALSVRMAPNFSLVDFAVHPFGYLARPGVIADVYELSRLSSPFYDFTAGPMNALHFVPGVTFGAGVILAR
jgi:hypothetical protein